MFSTYRVIGEVPSGESSEIERHRTGSPGERCPENRPLLLIKIHAARQLASAQLANILAMPLDESTGTRIMERLQYDN